MYSLEVLRTLNAAASQIAKERVLRPVEFNTANVYDLRHGDYGLLKDIPNLGDYCPVGWERVDLEEFDPDLTGVYLGDNHRKGAYFVDATGHGAKDEVALTISDFVHRVVPGYGYGIVESSQFQVKVGVFQYPAKAKRRLKAG